MPLTEERLTEIVAELTRRPGHEAVRVLMHELLVHGLGSRDADIHYELALPEVHGRADALLGRTVLELKTDLRREWREAEARLADYLRDREADTSEIFVGIVTDGNRFLAYDLDQGHLRQLAEFTPSIDEPRGVLAWLSSAVAVSENLTPDPETVTRELGRESLAWQVARRELRGLWEEVVGEPDVRLKRDLWARLLERVYGSTVDDDDLFFQHTYLTTIAKTMAIQVLGLPIPEPADLLAGRQFSEAAIGGVVESDFFDWPLDAGSGAILIRRIANQASRFRLRDVQTDVLKGLYESLIDPEQRHYLGEYYTPDWLAALMCEEAIEDPRAQRVLDPACGSGTFLFHAVRRCLQAAHAAGLSNHEAVSLCCNRVRGVDVHPVAVQIARVTYLLAIGEERLQDRPALAIPVYMGDSLQWNTAGFMMVREVEIEVPDSEETLHFPFAIAQDPTLFDRVVRQMLDLSGRGAGAEALEAWLRRETELADADIERLCQTYDLLRGLQEEERDHIWGFVARNLVRPAWLSREDERVDIIIGNPPWLAFNIMSPRLQEAFRAECQRLGVWVGGRGITPHQDLSAYFFARCVELYLRPTGAIAFIMPYATLSRSQYAAFRTGVFASRQGRRITEVHGSVTFWPVWGLSDKVFPLFPLPACVLFATNETAHEFGEVPVSRWPNAFRDAVGQLPRRDATPEEAAAAVTWQQAAMIPITDGERSVYENRFRQGAILIPRMLWIVELARAGRLGPNPTAPVVVSRRSSQENQPWRSLPPLRTNVERPFLRPVYLGASVAPFRVLSASLAVIPWDTEGGLLNATSAEQAGMPGLADWLRQAEVCWRDHGRGTRSLYEQLNFFGQLTAQLPVRNPRVVYAASGTYPAAAILDDVRGIAEHKLYWAAAEGLEEARYLTAILNSETARGLVEHLQSRGQWGARDFDKVMFHLPIPAYSPTSDLHRRLSQAAEHAEVIAARTEIDTSASFTRTRSVIRHALQQNGVAPEIDGLVTSLLQPIVDQTSSS